MPKEIDLEKAVNAILEQSDYFEGITEDVPEYAIRFKEVLLDRATAIRDEFRLKYNRTDLTVMLIWADLPKDGEQLGEITKILDVPNSKKWSANSPKHPFIVCLSHVVEMISLGVDSMQALHDSKYGKRGGRHY